MGWLFSSESFSKTLVQPRDSQSLPLLLLLWQTEQYCRTIYSPLYCPTESLSVRLGGSTRPRVQQRAQMQDRLGFFVDKMLQISMTEATIATTDTIDSNLSTSILLDAVSFFCNQIPLQNWLHPHSCRPRNQHLTLPQLL